MCADYDATDVVPFVVTNVDPNFARQAIVRTTNGDEYTTQDVQTMMQRLFDANDLEVAYSGCNGLLVASSNQCDTYTRVLDEGVRYWVNALVQAGAIIVASDDDWDVLHIPNTIGHRWFAARLDKLNEMTRGANMDTMLDMAWCAQVQETLEQSYNLWVTPNDGDPDDVALCTADNAIRQMAYAMTENYRCPSTMFVAINRRVAMWRN